MHSTIFPFTTGFNTRPAKFSRPVREGPLEKSWGRGRRSTKKEKENLTKEIREMFTKIHHHRHNFFNGLPHLRQS